MSEWFDPDGNPVDEATGMALASDPAVSRVEATQIGDGLVSTLYLGLDHSRAPGRPLIYETMTFDATGHVENLDRWSTRSEALEGHAAAVARARSGAGDGAGAAIDA